VPVRSRIRSSLSGLPFSVRTPNGCEASRNVPEPSNTGGEGCRLGEASSRHEDIKIRVLYQSPGVPAAENAIASNNQATITQ
jgi:hypothetical protein